MLERLRSGQRPLARSKAGTGKRTLIRAFITESERSLIAADPMGIAALNVERHTIHHTGRTELDVAPRRTLRGGTCLSPNVTSRACDVLVDAGARPGAVLLENARRHGIPVVAFEDFYAWTQKETEQASEATGREIETTEPYREPEPVVSQPAAPEPGPEPEPEMTPEERQVPVNFGSPAPPERPTGLNFHVKMLLIVLGLLVGGTILGGIIAINPDLVALGGIVMLLAWGGALAALVLWVVQGIRRAKRKSSQRGPGLW